MNDDLIDPEYYKPRDPDLWDRLAQKATAERFSRPVVDLAVELDDPVSPNHYKFSNGTEVIDISENLTSNGGQIVQYVARATRLDGKVKGKPVEDLRKARFFLDREIARLDGN